MSNKSVEPYLNISERETSPSFNQWYDRFGPLLLNPAGEELFETFGEDFELVRSFDPNRVWTVVEANNRQFITPGIHYVNRLNYYITSLPRKEDDEDKDIWREILLESEEFRSYELGI